MTRKNLTARYVETVKVDTRTDIWDDLVRGLVLRVSPQGAKTWTVVYSRESDGARQRATLGRFPAMSLEKARSKALAAMTAVSNGEDPAGKKRIQRASMTVRDLGGLYIKKYAKPNKRTWAEDERILERDVYPTIGNMKAMLIKRRDVLDVIEAKAEAGHVAQSRLVLATVRKMFNWAVASDYLESSPVAGVRPLAKPGQRDRVLSDDEIKTLLAALGDASMLDITKDVIRLLLLTGQRAGEVCGLHRGEIDFANETWSMAGARTKNGRAHVVPLCVQALAIVSTADARADVEDKEAPLFSRIGKAMAGNAIAHAVTKLQIFDEPWTAHDLRRSCATGMATIGVQPHIIEAVLNHVSGVRAGVAGIYNRAAYEPEKRAALQLWADHVDGIVTGKTPEAPVLPDNVVQLRRA